MRLMALILTAAMTAASPAVAESETEFVAKFLVLYELSHAICEIQPSPRLAAVEDHIRAIAPADFKTGTKAGISWIADQQAKDGARCCMIGL